MFVRNLTLINFRLFQKKQFSFRKKSTLLSGRNGSGKTTVLEALHLLSTGKTFVQSGSSILIHQGEESFQLQTALFEDVLEKDIFLTYDRKRLKISVDGKPTTINQINEFYFTLFFSSFNYNLFLTNRVLLRRLFDQFCGGVVNLYNQVLMEYNQILKQKNFLLRQKNFTPNEIFVWNKGLAASAVQLVKWRRWFLNELLEELVKLSDNAFEIRYIPHLSPECYAESEKFEFALNQLLEKERMVQSSCFGPHRDAYQINVEQLPISYYSSGQRKKYLLLIYFAYLNLFRQKRGFAPLFLFDDFDVAMDYENINFLWQRHPDVQIIATSVHEYNFFDEQILLDNRLKDKE